MTLVHSGRARILAPMLAAAGCAALLLRTVSYEATAMTLVVGVAGGLATRRHRPTAALPACAVVLAVGTGSFLASRLLASPIGARLTAFGVATIVISAIAEEAFFRGFLYERCERRGPVVAIAVTAALFAAVHLPMYGAAAMPIDVAAGAVLSWQRWTTGTWIVPAVTHVVANLMQMG